MNRTQLEHIIRAASANAEDDELIIIGSQAIHAQVRFPPHEAVRSTEADVYPRNHPERAELIDGAIGELSGFHDTYGSRARRLADDSHSATRLGGSTGRAQEREHREGRRFVHRRA